MLSRTAALLFGILQCAEFAVPSQAAPVASQSQSPKSFDFSISLAFDVGTASMARFEEGLQSFSEQLTTINPEINIVGNTGPGLMLGFSPRFRLYLPHQTFIEAGLGYLRSQGKLNIDIGTLPARYSYTNTSVELPILFGVHLAQHDQTHIYGALGPTLLLHSRSSWSYDRGEASDFFSPRGGGIELMIGSDVFVRDRVSLTFALRYRFLRSSALALEGHRYPPVPSLGELDFSGISASAGARWHSF